jgi:hypothetical protein
MNNHPEMLLDSSIYDKYHSSSELTPYDLLKIRANEVPVNFVEF